MVCRSAHLHIRKLAPRQIIFHCGIAVSNLANHISFQHYVVTTCIRSVLLRCRYVLGATESHVFVCSSSHVAIPMCPAHRCYTKGQSAKSATAQNRDMVPLTCTASSQGTPDVVIAVPYRPTSPSLRCKATNHTRAGIRKSAIRIHLRAEKMARTIDRLLRYPTLRLRDFLRILPFVHHR